MGERARGKRVRLAKLAVVRLDRKGREEVVDAVRCSGGGVVCRKKREKGGKMNRETIK